ncbi:MAG: type II secretion system minor pseudopilin GspK [Pseudomonadota bacterium]
MISGPRNEEGAALLSVLLLVAVMSVLALAMSEVAFKSVQRSAAADARSRIAWQITGAEEAGQLAAEQLNTLTQGALNLQIGVLNTPIVLPANGGVIEGQLRDASNCFNLNALSTQNEEGEVSADTVALYTALLTALNFSELEAEALTDALIDWMDPDTQPRLAGAEDNYYVGLRPPYRSSGQPLADLTELRAILGYDQSVMERLGHLVCVRPSNEPGLFNINTITEREAPLLVMVFSEEFDLPSAERLIIDRPIGGWPNLEPVLTRDEIGRISPELLRTDLIGIRSTYVSFAGTARFDDVAADFETTYQFRQGEPSGIIRRDYGAR